MTHPNARPAAPEHPLLHLLQPNKVVNLISNGLQIVGRIEGVSQSGAITLDTDPWGTVHRARSENSQVVPETGVPVSRTPTHAVVMLFAVQGVMFYPEEG